MTEKNIKHAFECTGLHPFDPEKILIKFMEKEVERPSSSESSTSVLRAEDWQKIRALLKEVVIDTYSTYAQKLSNTVNSLATKCELLRFENQGLKRALINEKKKRQRQKLLILDLPTSADGRVIFYTPNKVKEVRHQQQQKIEDAGALWASKDEEKKRKAAEKAEKARLVEERKKIRAHNHMIKLQKQAQNR
jgi:hypothetical protein